MRTAADFQREYLAKDRIFAKHGDILLEPYFEGKPTGTLLVSSHVLSIASPVFNAMFNGTFSEGHSLSTKSPKKVPLPADNPEALILLCKITHMQTSRIEDIFLNAFADFAVLCDKYQCTEAVAFWSKVHIAYHLKYKFHCNREKLLFIAYVLDLPDEFQQVTVHLIRDIAEPFSYKRATHGLSMVPMVVLDELRIRRNALMSELSHKIWPKAYDDLLTSDCVVASLRLRAYLASLQNAQILVGACLTAAEIKKRSSTLRGQIDAPSCEEHMDCAVARAKNMNEEVAQDIADIYDKVKGCCMDCMQRKVFGSKDLCRSSQISCAGFLQD